MKRIIVFVIAATLAFGSITSRAVGVMVKETKSAVKEKIEVYYFHFTRRCMTCNAVETEARKAVESLYPEEVKNGTVKFIEINLDNKNSKPAVEKAKAQGQALIIVKGDKRVDLTTQGFMYAVSNPERLKNEIKKAVDNMLTSN